MKLLAPFIAVCLMLIGVLAWLWVSSNTAGTDANGSMPAGKMSPVQHTRVDSGAQVQVESHPPAQLTEQLAPTPPNHAVNSEPAAREGSARDAEVAAAVEPSPAAQPAVRWADDVERTNLERRLSIAQAALVLDPSNTAALRDATAALCELGRWAEAADLFARHGDVETATLDLRFEYASVLMRLQRWASAARTLKSVVREDESHARAWFNLAVTHQALGRLQESLRAWDRTIALMPDNAEAYTRRGEVRLDLQRWAAAAADFELAVQQDADTHAARLNLSLAYWKLGRLADARACLLPTLERHPQHVPTLNRMAELAWAEYQADAPQHPDQLDAAITWWQRSLAIDSAQTQTRAALNAALAASGR
ncbi:MAG: tetratricopeptide repeat protein [Planctomycetes bacterium]|nr:tetratricopeptide repeat protein [Planctomycetota bacterium]